MFRKLKNINYLDDKLFPDQYLYFLEYAFYTNYKSPILSIMLASYGYILK